MGVVSPTVTPLTVCVHHNASCRVADEAVSPASHATSLTRFCQIRPDGMEPPAGVARQLADVGTLEGNVVPVNVRLASLCRRRGNVPQ
jgi:hypothetical protein